MDRRFHDRIESDPAIRGGEPVFRGSRIPVHAIARKLDLGSSLEELLEDYPALSSSDLSLAREYVARYPEPPR